MTQIHKVTDDEIIYPESDGKPLAENTLQFDYILMIKEGIEDLFSQNPDVFVAGDLLWYPVEGQPKINVAPNTMGYLVVLKGFANLIYSGKKITLLPKLSLKFGRKATENKSARISLSFTKPTK